MSNLKGKVAIITGGSRGIGLAIAQVFRSRDSSVVITGTNEPHLDRAVRDLNMSRGDGDVLGVCADVRHYAEIEQLVRMTVDRFGGLDILVNNAGVGIWRAVSDMSVEEWHEVIDTNLTGVFYCCRAAIPYLRARDSGWIINISSLASKNAFVEGAAYCASKSGLNAFSESLMQEVRYDGIRVAYVMPGSVRTEFSGRIKDTDDWKLSPQDVAQVVVDLIEHPARSLPSRVEIRPARPPRKS
jgi:NAD(P)-dependent dehydrogenase (short-subunit alcohol dehydrogenase family)